MFTDTFSVHHHEHNLRDAMKATFFSLIFESTNIKDFCAIRTKRFVEFYLHPNKDFLVYYFIYNSFFHVCFSLLFQVSDNKSKSFVIFVYVRLVFFLTVRYKRRKTFMK